MKVVPGERYGRLIQTNKDLYDIREKECLCLNCKHLPPTIAAREARIRQAEEDLKSLPLFLTDEKMRQARSLVVDMLKDKRREEALKMISQETIFDQMHIAQAELSRGTHPIKLDGGCHKADWAFGFCVMTGNSFLMEGCEQYEPASPAKANENSEDPQPDTPVCC